MVAVCPAVTTADVGGEHGSSRLCPPSISITSGDRPETWYRPGGSGTQNVPEDPTVTATGCGPPPATGTGSRGGGGHRAGQGPLPRLLPTGPQRTALHD